MFIQRGINIIKKKLTLIILGLFIASSVSIQGIFGSLDQDKQAAESKVVQFRSELESLKGQVDEILKKVESVQKQITLVKDKIAFLDNEKVALEHNIIEKEAQVDAANAEFDVKKTYVYQRARQVYEDGNVDYTAVVLASFDLTDYINNSEYYHIIKEKETQKINEIKKERVKLEEQKKELEVVKVALEENKQKVVIEQGNLEVENQKLKSSKSIINKAVSSKTSQLNSEEAALASINAEIISAKARYAYQIALLKKAAAEAARANNNSSGRTIGISDTGNTGEKSSFNRKNVLSSSKFIWPVSGFVTSEYGLRWGVMHRGLDIGAPHGAPIIAADRGVVLVAGFTGDGFGGKVVIQHANGLITLYGHMSSIGVVAGSTVTRGQYIGAVGNTGNSFGAHLHFQVSNTGNMYDGVNPRNYLI